MTGGAAATVRTLTVLFTDLVDSTGIRSRVGEEEAERLRVRHDRLVRGAVLGTGGVIVKHTGDGIMATFEGAAEAVAAAVSVQQALDLDNRQGQVPEPLHLRIGISAGDVTVDDSDCFGLPVIEAQRLEAAARPGQILASSLVRLLSKGRGGHEFASVGALELKGLDGPVDADEVRWAPRAEPRAEQLPPALADRGAFPFAGRTKESEILAGALTAVSTGATRLVLVAGEPGIGKTRLVGHSAGQVIDKGGVVLAGRSDEMVSAAYQPFSEALRHQLRGPGGAQVLGSAPGELARLVPELTDVVPDLPPPLSAEPEAERLRLFEGVRGWLAELAGQAVVMLVLDDLHWADAGSLLLLRHLVVTDPVPGLLVVGTYRDTELDRTHPLSSMLGELRRRADVIRVVLEGLDAGEVTDLMALAAGHDLEEDGMALAMAVRDETGGNPFFVGEVLRHLAESGAIVYSDGRWQASRSGDDRLLPEGIREVVGRRVSALPDGAQAALASAAVIGVGFDLDVLAAVTQSGEDDLIDALEPALTAHLVIETGVGRYRFAHALVRSTLHQELSTTRRARLHRVVAQTLESLHPGDIEVVTADLAYHWAEAGAASAHDEAIFYARRAGELANQRLAPEEAARWYRQARELLDGSDAEVDVELLGEIGKAEAVAALPTWQSTLLEAARAADALGRVDLMAEALCVTRRTATYQASPEPVNPDKIALLERALQYPQDDALRSGRLMAALAQELIFAGEFARRDELLEAVMACCDGVEDPIDRFRLRGSMLWLQAPTRWAPANAAHWHQEAIDVLSLARQRGDMETAVNAHSFLHLEAFLWGIGDRRQLMREYDELLAAYPHPDLLDRRMASHLVQAITDGDVSRVERCSEEIRRVWTAHGRPEVSTYADSGLIQATRERSGLGLLVDLLASLPGRELEADKPGELGALLVTALIEGDRLPEARERVDLASQQGFSRISEDAAYPVAVCLWSEAAARTGHVEACRELYAMLLPGAHQCQFTGGWFLGATSHYLGLLAEALSDHETADQWFEEAMDLQRRIDSPPWVARTLVDRAEALVARGDPTGARQIVDEALAVTKGTELAFTQARAELVLAALT